MPVGELFLSAFLQVLFDRLAPRQLLQLALQESLRSKLQKWEQKLRMIQAVLSDAEERQLDPKNTAVKLWLDDLQDLAYDVEDILDEFATQALQRKLIAEHRASTSKVHKLIPASFTSFSPHAIKFNVSMSSKIEGITTRLKQLCKTKADLGLKEISGGPSTALSRRLESTSVPIEPAVYGRDADKAKILEMVVNDEPSDANFRVIPIVGMGGIGKTTVAREVFNDMTVKSFNPRVWVCVSDNFDVLKISKAILESITSVSCDVETLNQVQVKLRDEVAGKKFFLVLDDIWNEDYSKWESLKSPFMAGAHGSRIILTTRILEVVSITTGSTESHCLKPLSEEDCWSVFVKHAFEKKDIDQLSNLKSIQEKVVAKCGGLPLAARTLGGLLRCKQRDDEWENILNSKIWDLPGNNNEIPTVLKLSYHYLPSHLKRCFAYCAIFPKYYEFLKKDLILLWMAEGLIQVQPSNKDNEQPEVIGGKYFDDLLSRSIFQHSSSDNSKFVMHDLVNDLAQWASRETTFRLEDELRVNNDLKSFKKVRYLSYTCGKYNDKNKFEVFNEFWNLRTFFQVLQNDDLHCIANIVPSELLPKFKKLRVLSLRNYNIIDLPDSIGDLRHLRYVNFSNLKIRSLPESLGMLFNLQVLILTNCWDIKKLPPMGNLINLRHLYIERVSLREMPLGMENWKYLRTLSKFVVGKSSGSNLKVLKNLKFLHGKLYISELKNVTDLEDAVLMDKKNLDDLLLRWRDVDEGLLSEEAEEKEKKVLDMLRPHNNLKKLKIDRYGGTRLSAWVGDSSFSNMTDLILDYCQKCTSLPSLALLGSLKNLSIRFMMRLKGIGHEIYGEDPSKSFQSLETLCFECLHEWEHWDSINSNEYAVRFPYLRELSVVNCPKLSGSLPEHLPSLEKLRIFKCVQLAVSLNRLPSLGKLVINECAQLKVWFSTLPMLRELGIHKCKEMVCSGPIDGNLLSSMTLSNISQTENWLSWQTFQKVEHLRIIGCQQLINSFWQNEIYPQKPPQGMQNLTSLRELCIENCSSLVSFPESKFLCTLVKLEIRNCNSLTCIVRGRLPSSLTELSVEGCEKLQNLLDDKDDDGVGNSSTTLLHFLSIFSFSSLRCLSSKGRLHTTLEQFERLNIQACDSLTFIVSGNIPSSLRQLSVGNCQKLQCLLDDRDDVGTSSSSSLMHRENIDKTTISRLEYLSISSCTSLTCLSSKGQLPTTLKHLCIFGCSNLSTLSSMGQLPALKKLQVCYCSELAILLLEGQLPKGLEFLDIWNCSKLELIVERFHNNKALKDISIGCCDSLRFIPDGLQNLCALRSIFITYCPSLFSFPEGGLPNAIQRVIIRKCEKLEVLPNYIHSLNCLQGLTIEQCPSIVTFPEEGLPTSLTSLAIKGPKIYNLLIEWGLHKLTSLQKLDIRNCPSLSSFPREGLPSSVVYLYISRCPLLQKQCKRNEGREWSKIAHIPYINVF